MKNLPTYVLITPARNEAELIEFTLRSVVAQTAKPLKWVIVSDGSTDGTDEIVARYAVDYPWIELVRMPARRERHFAGKVYAFNAGYARMAGLPYEAIGNLDGDTSFDADYFSYLLQKLAENPKLGLVGGHLVDAPSGEKYDHANTGVEYVSGPCQLFRRDCWEAIGGYQPMKSGGVDMVAVLSARMKGWGVHAFPEKECHHHRPMNGAQMSGFRERLHRGRMDYLLGSHPLWEVSRSIYQMRYPPYVIGGILIFVAYFWRLLTGVERTMPADLIAFRRKAQLQRLKQLVRSIVPFGNRPAEEHSADQPRTA
jgi:cellulose synthase/poly-beta-1,6-N-acetylglucosamine synthase-like glycosyltransferase